MWNKKINLAVIGLGYVGLPLAVEFGKEISVLGFDIDQVRVAELNKMNDRTLEVDKESLISAKYLKFSSNPDSLHECNVFIITVPTPIDEYKKPDLKPLLAASETVAKRLKRGDIVIYESTVYPGATEDDCVPVLERVSNLKYNSDFFVGYSPERINPGDRNHRLVNIKKVTSGSTNDVAKFVDNLYKKIIVAGTHMAPSIRVAEAAKVIENTQRDVNIALINELAMLFGKMKIDTEAVLEAAGTKWNFLNFRPGLVGGHCIGVDPYYLTFKAESFGYHPQIILSGRKINDSMGSYVGAQLIKGMLGHGIDVNHSRVLILGLSFKENCPDIRNTKVVDIIKELEEYNIKPDVYDPWVNPADAEIEYGIKLISDLKYDTYDAIIIAVSHPEFKNMGFNEIKKYMKKDHFIYDLKHVLNPNEANLKL